MVRTNGSFEENEDPGRAGMKGEERWKRRNGRRAR